MTDQRTAEKVSMDKIKVETVHTITLPLYPPPPPEANSYGQPQVQVIVLNTAMARELADRLTALLGGAT